MTWSNSRLVSKNASGRSPDSSCSTPHFARLCQPVNRHSLVLELTPAQVLEYLNKKGYSKTEATLRREVADRDGTPISRKVQDKGWEKYSESYTLLENYVDDTLEVYRPELVRLLWPIFVQSYFGLVIDFCPPEALSAFFREHSPRFQREHQDELRQLQVITEPAHVQQSAIGKIYRGDNNKYRLTLSSMAWASLIQFLESKQDQGGVVIQGLISSYVYIVTTERAATASDRSLAAMLARGGEDFDIPAEDEGIPGHNPGSANTDRNAPTVLPNLKLGQMPMDPDAMEDVRAELKEEDERNPPANGENSLLEEFEQRIKQEPADDAPSREQIPLPPPLMRDIKSEVGKIREYRDRFKIDPKTSGVGPGVSVCMYTFHNTHDNINCLDFSGDLMLVAAGTQQSYIRVWSLDGKPIPNMNTGEVNDPNAQPSSSKRLIGHSGPVYAVHFSPATPNPSREPPSTAPRYLLSSSADKTVRLWSCDTWTCLVAYRGHDSPVWDVRWGPHGYYFLSAGHDKVARLWNTENIAPLRMFVAHDNDVDVCAFHPNGVYVFTAGDKNVRMWDISRGNPVRMFTGHTGNITAIECSPNGQTLASADDQGSIFLWDLASGTRIKRMRGHGKGGIWSLSWSVESSVLVSGGADLTVRVWDVIQKPSEKGSDGATAVKAEGPSTTAAGTTTGAAGGVQKKSKKDVVVTQDQISAFPTKKSPVYKVMFTRSNLVIAGSAYLPELYS
ncbi:hypothetical protein, variant [Verruconis gallopava]|uniref:TFIID subunit TAF5 NTD2 domain-containing protein n=1 Tax=Verruconis gallopava TaxID=253628 RepID=A0A0D1XF65_9PEZI|nr:hypothetical protein, variant [Verruconis gallopava]KIW00851.1 hypothetical protein, variant [Verruconis gallopava]